MCTFGTGSRTIMVVGDSVAMAWVPTVVAASSGSRILAVGVPSCSPWDVQHGSSLGVIDYQRACSVARAGILQRVPRTTARRRRRIELSWQLQQSACR